MILEVVNPISKEVGRIKELTIEDFRSIAFMIENESDSGLESFLSEKILGDVNIQTKLLTLMQARMKFVSEQITFNNGTANVTIDLKFLWKELITNLTSGYRIISFDTFDIELDYPSRLIHSSTEDLMYDCIKDMKVHHKHFNFKELTEFEKIEVISKMNAKVVNILKDTIEELDVPIVIFKAKANIPDIVLSLFDNSTFVFIRALFGYYNYDEITELLYSLSKRIPDMQYLISRNPRDLELLVRLYTEEIEKSTTETKSL